MLVGHGLIGRWISWSALRGGFSSANIVESHASSRFLTVKIVS